LIQLKGHISIETADPRFGMTDQVVLSQDDPDAVELAEDETLRSHAVTPEPEARPLAFVDGVRRSECWLYLELPDSGNSARGLAGAFGVGCVCVEPGQRPEFGEHRIERLLIWGSGADPDENALAEVEGGWRWQPVAIADGEPDAPLHELQRRMRAAEAALAEELAGGGVLTVLDGTLTLVNNLDVPVMGYVKSHHRALLAPDDHTRVPRLRLRERTTLFQLHRQGPRSRPYSCYFRLAETAPMASPWSGIVRLEVPESGGLEQARHLVDRVAAALVPFAGVPHRDPRAPQNLQPIGALEDRLRHLLGSPALAARAVRDAVRQLRENFVASATVGAPTPAFR
jgi:hypothetical protein